ncbi:hypothetical protein LAZ67_17002625, partial [Cordylochernes scorpioides]
MIRLPPGIEIGRFSIGTIMSDVLNFRKVCARWVPRLLSENHKQQRMEAARAFLEMHRRDGDQLFSRIVTGDESWVHHSTPETKRQSMVWKKPEESAPKKAKVTISVGKVMAIVFWDCKGVLLVDYLPPNTTVNAARYCEILTKLRAAIKRKRPGLLSRKVLLVHDNARPHAAQTTQTLLENFKWEILTHPPYSPELAPSDFYLFPALKLHLGGKHFVNDDEVQAEANHWLRRQDTAWYNSGIKKLLQRYQKCLDRNDLKLAEFLLKMILGKNAQNVLKITDLIKENPRTTLLELEQDTGISKTTIGRIVIKDLKLKKTPTKFIPRFPTNEQKLCRLATCENMLEMTRTDPEWKDKIITGDETWVYDYDPETKRQYAEWRGQGEPRPKKSRILKSRNKVLLVAFLDNKGIVHHEYLPAGQTVIKEMYLDILRHLREAIRKKMPEKWPNGDWILHHNNARPHTAHLIPRPVNIRQYSCVAIVREPWIFAKVWAMAHFNDVNRGVRAIANYTY